MCWKQQKALFLVQNRDYNSIVYELLRADQSHYRVLLIVSAVEWKVSMLRGEKSDGNKMEESKDRL